MSVVIAGVDGIEEVGRGGSGVVYRGWQPEFGRWVAVKVFPADEDARRLARERLAVGRLSDHPGIVPVLDGGITEDGRAYLIMSYMDGGSLADRVRSQGPPAVEEAVAFGVAMAAALQVAHDSGIRHRDLKPANILYDRFGTPRLADFGIAHLGGDSFRTEAGLVSGTVAYMAPEVLEGREFTAAADVFSLGATLYYAVEGRHLFEPRPQEHYAAFVVRRITAPPVPAWSPRVPAWLRDVVAAAVDPDPDRRIPTAAALAAALRAGAPPTRVAFAAAPPAPPPPRAYQDPQAPPPPQAYPDPPYGAPGPVPPYGAPGPVPAYGTPVPVPAYGTPAAALPPYRTPTQPPHPPFKAGGYRSGQERPAPRWRAPLVAVVIALVLVAGTAQWLRSRTGPGTAAPAPSAAPPSGGLAGPQTPTVPASGSGTPATRRPATQRPVGQQPATQQPVVTGARGQAAITEAVEAFRAELGGGNPLVMELIFYPDRGSSGAYAVADLPQPKHPANIDEYVYRDGRVGSPRPLQSSPFQKAEDRWHLNDVTWTAAGAMMRDAERTCRAAMVAAGVTDEKDTFGQRAGISHVAVERDNTFNDGKVVVRVYFGGGARWSGGYVLFDARGKKITDRYCAVS